jgi:hypothetical protein
VSVKLGEPEHHAKDAEKAKAPDVVSRSAKPAMLSAAAFWYLPAMLIAFRHAPLRCWGAIHGSLIRLEPARLEHFGCFRRF